MVPLRFKRSPCGGRLASLKEGKGRGPPPRCLGVWGREGRTQPFRKNGRPVRLFTPTLRFLGISSIGLPLFGFRLLRSEEHTSELQSHHDLVCRLLLEKKN